MGTPKAALARPPAALVDEAPEKEELALVHRAGRFDDSDPRGPRFSWPATRLSTRMRGDALAVRLAGPAHVYFEIEVDGASVGRFETRDGEHRYALVSGLTVGEHEVAIVRRNEGSFGVVQFLGFEGAELIPSPSPYRHHIEIVGDSISAGSGIEGTPPCSFSAATESAYLTYGAIAARNLKASLSLVAYSGKGLIQNFGGDTRERLPTLYRRTLTTERDSRWDFFAPRDAVIVNLGTNDFSVPVDGARFEAAYVELLREIRGHHPDAIIVAVHWAHWGKGHEARVQRAAAALDDERVHTLRMRIDADEGWGCDEHPSRATHARLGAELTATLARLLGIEGTAEQD